VAGSFGGGKSGFRRIESHLLCHLVGDSPQVSEGVADLLLAAGDDLPRWGLVDRVGDLAQRLLHLLPHPVNEFLARHLGRRFHGKNLLGKRALPILTNPH
jgi:hypothetical protein